MTNELTRKSLDLPALRARLSKAEGPEYWRSLDELAGTDEFQDLLEREFPEQADTMPDELSRRRFVQLMGASLAFGGLVNCTIQPAEKIVPFVRAPENVIPGRPLFYATAVPLSGVGTGVLVESHMGRPTKIEGNPKHPASLGSSDALTQARILELYDPDRAQVITNAGHISTWGSFVTKLNRELDIQRLKGGKGLRILTETITSPTLGHQLSGLLQEFPQAQWHQYEPANSDNKRNGAVLAFGEPLNTVYEFDKAKVILSLDADFLFSGAASVRHARDYASARRVTEGSLPNRLYMVEGLPTVTGSVADHRMALDSGQVESFAMTLADALGVKLDAAPADAFEDKARWLQALAADLKANKGASIVVAGEQQSPAVHALAHAMNQVLGNVGHTVRHTAPLEVESVNQLESISGLVADMQADRVELLLILGGNPVYTAPADLDFAAAMERVNFRTHLHATENETSARCHWHVPETHFLETWGDVRGYDGTVTIMQPLIQPLYNSKSAHEMVGTLIGQSGQPPLTIIQKYWEQQPALAAGSFDANWQTAVHDGVVRDSQLPSRTAAIANPLRLPATTGQHLGDDELELQLRPDPTVWDGRFANNGWLQETPNPITKLTWDNAALISPLVAERLGLSNEQVVTLGTTSATTVNVPVWIVPGQADKVVTLHLGYGRETVGRVGRGAGVDAYRLRTTTNEWQARSLQLSKTFETSKLACTQDHHSMEGRGLVRHADHAEFLKNPNFAHDDFHDPADDFSLYAKHVYEGNQWGMAIDLNACIGCNACSVACQSENNIPIVGKEQVLNGREMSWIRIDRYYSDDLDDPEILHQPVPCQQCENAPCELVCPVTATSHSEEGLNDMVYNRCVGTRYCSNNCPYKVRRFNWHQYADRDSPSLKIGRNPDVTVRPRGVMEKCTYCTQRINAARIDSKKSDSPIADGQIQTACQQACPTQAIAFGNINDAASEVSKWKASPLNYGILTDLNTRPRTTYLARLKNPNPAITKA
jgi:MoCo/4Fe-4S cofactor protein with predicted Tat translocation signal